MPQTFKEAMFANREAVIVTTATSPYRIVHVNQKWEDMCGFTKNEVVGKTFGIVHGERTDTDLIDSKLRTLLNGGSTDVVDMYLVNYNKGGKALSNYITMGKISFSTSESSNDSDFIVTVMEEIQADEVTWGMLDY